MATITLRQTKGSPLTIAEVDTNFSNLNTFKVELTGSTGSAILPVGTTAQRNGSPVAGYLRFNSETSQFEGYNGTSWSSVGSATISNDTSTNGTFYPTLTTSTSGIALSLQVSSTKLSFNPSTGLLTATGFSGSGASLTSLSAGNISSGTLAVARGGTGRSTYTDGQLLIGNTLTSSLSVATLTAGTNVSITNGNGSITITSTDTIATITNDTSTDTTQYPAMLRSTSGNLTQSYVASTKLYFNPSTGQLNATNFNSLSDAGLKTNVTSITNATNIVGSIEGVEFDWIDTGKKSAGVIAQQLEAVLPHLVDTDSAGIKSVNYSGIIAYLVEMNKEMSARISELERKLA